MIREETFRRKLRWRGRGRGDLERLVGGIFPEIEACLARHAPVRILELGCGYGTALLDLRVRYGEQVALHGLNRVRHDGDPEVLLHNARERGLLAAGATPATGWLPTLHYADVAAGLPFPDAAFDVVYSQVAWLYFANKIAVLQEVMRILAPGGIAKIDVDEVRRDLPPEYARLVEIWEHGTLLPFGTYAGRHGVALMPADEGEYLAFGRSPTFGTDLEPVLEIDLGRVNEHWDGIKCVYRTRVA